MLGVVTFIVNLVLAEVLLVAWALNPGQSQSALASAAAPDRLTDAEEHGNGYRRRGAGGKIMRRGSAARIGLKSHDDSKVALWRRVKHRPHSAAAPWRLEAWHRSAHSCWHGGHHLQPFERMASVGCATHSGACCLLLR